MKRYRRFLNTLKILSIWITALHAQTSIPPYHQHANFLLTSPGAFGNGLLGYVNPAVVNLLHGPDFRFIVSDENGTFMSYKRWGLFTGIPHIGFGVIQQRYPVSVNTTDQKDIRVSDYRIAFAGGNATWSFGLGYGWSRGDLEYAKRDDVWLLGTLVRPNRHLSVGLSSSIAQHRNIHEAIFDLALRPFGSDIVTLFGDFSWQRASYVADHSWSVGGVFQPLSGLHLTGRYFNSETFTVGLSFSLSTAGFSAQTHFDNHQKLGYTTYGVRLGTREHNIIDRYFKKEKKYLSLDLKGRIGYRKYRFFDPHRQTLTGILSALKNAADDPRVAGVALSLSGMHSSREYVWEIRKQLEKLRQASKRIVIYLDRGRLTEYHLASVADRIIMDPEGMLILEGYVMGRTYLRGTLEKLGLGFEEWRYFKYKSANETFSRDRMSEADQEQRQALLDDLYDLVCRDVCTSRGFTETHFDSLINEKTLFLSQEAVQEGLVDTLGRWADIEKIIESFEGEKKGLIQPKSLTKNAFPPREWGSRPQIAIVYTLGVCALDYGINARNLEKILDRLAQNPRIKAVIVRVDSPGGDGLASDLVAEAIRKCAEKKPVIVSQGRVAASGGYWISVAADTIIAAPNTITGSIGVIGGWIWNKGLGTKLGMTSDHVKRGKHADFDFGIRLPLLGLRLPDRNLNPQERSQVEKAIHIYYRTFVSKVARSRGMDEDAVENIAQGRVWSGIDATENDLVDLIGGLQMAIDVAREASRIPAGKEIDLIELPRLGWFNPNIFSPKLFGIQIEEREENGTMDYLEMISRFPGQPLPMLPLDWIPEE